jgi:hypothetical protein
MRRSYGAIQWTCITPGSRWKFSCWSKPDWGVWELLWFNGRGQTEGWYLSHPDIGDKWMGLKFGDSAERSEGIILAAMPRTAEE